MPTVITHAAVPICLGLGLGLKVIPPRIVSELLWVWG